MRPRNSKSRLQLGVFLSVTLSLTAWLVLLAIYIPYILFYSPMVVVGEFETEEERLEIAVPGQDYGTGSAAAIIILLGVFVDMLLLSGTYKKYKLKGDLLIPWLFFYSVFSVTLFGIAILVGMMCEGVYKSLCVVPAFIAVFYIYIWVCVLHLFRQGRKPMNLIMKRLNSIAMEPLVEIAKKSMREKENEYV